MEFIADLHIHGKVLKQTADSLIIRGACASLRAYRKIK